MRTTVLPALAIASLALGKVCAEWTKLEHCERMCNENDYCCKTTSSGFDHPRQEGWHSCATKWQHCVAVCNKGGWYTCDFLGNDSCTEHERVAVF